MFLSTSSKIVRDVVIAEMERLDPHIVSAALKGWGRVSYQTFGIITRDRFKRHYRALSRCIPREMKRGMRGWLIAHHICGALQSHYFAQYDAQYRT